MSRRSRRRLEKLRSAAIGIAVVLLAVGGWYGFRAFQNRKMAGAMAAERGRTVAGTSAEAPPPMTFRQDLVIWEGKTWRRNTYVKAILCMGIDRSDAMTEYRGFDEAGQADGIFLVAQDTFRGDLKVLMIPRDTMTEIGIINRDMSDAGTEVRQLTLAYANGDGREGSCENMVEATERLLQGFPIDHYLAADTQVISRLNDAVGGVTVTVPTAGMEKADPAFVQGATVTLHGKQAEKFVRYRDIQKDLSALYRMDQQQEYISRYFQAVKEKSRTDSQIVTELFGLIQDYIVTDMGKETYLKIGADALSGDGLQNEDFFTLPGTGVTTEAYDEFHADPDGVVRLVLQLFYREAQ